MFEFDLLDSSHRAVFTRCIPRGVVAGSGQSTFTIARASSVTVVFCPSSVVFTGSAVTACAAVVTGVGGLSTSGSVSYSGNTNVGTASAQGVFVGDGNHTGSVSAAAVFTITKAPSAFYVYCPASLAFTGSALTPCTASVSGVGGLLAPVVVSYSGNTNAGTATAQVVFAGDANHMGAFAARSFTITRAASVVTVSCTMSVVFTGAALTPCTVSVTGVGGLSMAPAAVYSTNINVGKATVTYTYIGDANHTGSTATKTFTITKRL